jgi:hypothetical protein
MQGRRSRLFFFLEKAGQAGRAQASGRVLAPYVPALVVPEKSNRIYENVHVLIIEKNTLFILILEIELGIEVHIEGKISMGRNELNSVSKLLKCSF